MTAPAPAFTATAPRRPAHINQLIHDYNWLTKVIVNATLYGGQHLIPDALADRRDLADEYNAWLAGPEGQTYTAAVATYNAAVDRHRAAIKTAKAEAATQREVAEIRAARCPNCFTIRPRSGVCVNC